MLIVPSVWQEGFGMVAVEAQAAGKPVIASHIGGLPESVGSGGILISDHDNPIAWANAITTLRNDSTTYARLIHQGYESLQREEFSEKRVVEKFEQLTNQLIHR